MQQISFGSVGTTIVFAIVITVAVLLLFGLTCLSSKYTLRSKFGVHDPVFRATSRYNYMLTAESVSGLIQPYVYYHGDSYFMFGNNGLLSRRNRAKKVDILTQKQLTNLFPLQTYKEWMNGGKEEQENNNNGKIGYSEMLDTEEQIRDETTRDLKQQMETDITDFNSHVHALTSRASATYDIPLKDTFSIHASLVDTEKDLADGTIKRDPVISVKSTHVTEGSTNDDSAPEKHLHFSSGTCAICLEDLEDDDEVRGLMCGHVYHKDCIDPWLTKRKGCCPICKKDLYLEINQDEAANEADNVDDVNSLTNNPNQDRDVMNFDLNRIVRLPRGEPGSMEIDRMFSISYNNIFAFFMLMIITKVEAQTLLVALQYLRNNNYSLDNSPSTEAVSGEGSSAESTVEEPETDVLQLVTADLDQYGAATYAQRVADKFKQDNVSESFKSPPLPDLANLNPQIKKLVEHYPRPFHPADLEDLDMKAWKETHRMRRGVKVAFFKFLGVNEIDLYYHNVVKLYNKRRDARLAS
jgi:hypothetical protein